MSPYYLIDHPNDIKKQYRESRRATPTGAIVLHTPEADVDLNPPDTKARDVLSFISRRDGYGSYHAGVDSDSIDLGVPFSYEVWGATPRSPRGDLDDLGDPLRANSIAIHLFVACDHDQWTTLPIWWVTAAIENLALLASSAADWVHAEHGIVVPARFGTLEDFWDKRPGFYDHGTLDPARRKDPGVTFPRDLFLDQYTRAAGHLGPAGTLVERIQQAAKATGYTVDVDGVLDDRDAAAIENMAEGIARLLDEAKAHESALSLADQARVDAIARAAELDAQLGGCIAERAQLHDRNVVMERFLGRMASTWHRVAQLQAEVDEIIETAQTYVDDASALQPPAEG